MADHALNHTLEMLRKKIRLRMNDLSDDVATGACVNFEQYRHTTGRIAGMVECETMLLELDQAMREDDDD